MLSLLGRRLLASKLPIDQKGRRLENPRKNKLFCRTIDHAYRLPTRTASFVEISSSICLIVDYLSLICALIFVLLNSQLAKEL